MLESSFTEGLYSAILPEWLLSEPCLLREAGGIRAALRGYTVALQAGWDFFLKFRRRAKFGKTGDLDFTQVRLHCLICFLTEEVNKDRSKAFLVA